MLLVLLVLVLAAGTELMAVVGVVMHFPCRSCRHSHRRYRRRRRRCRHRHSGAERAWYLRPNRRPLRVDVAQAIPTGGQQQ